MSPAPRRHAAETYDRSLPHVSIVVPVKDTDPDLLRAAVASAVHQDCPERLEIVVWDDGSTNNATRTALVELPGMSEVDRLVRISGTPDNLGISAARNAACAIARGVWFLWLDSDDTLPPSSVRRLLATTRRGHTRLVFGRCEVTCPDGRRRIRHAETFVRNWWLRRDTVGDPLAAAVFAVHGGLVHRDLFVDVGGFEESLRFAELTDWVVRAMAMIDSTEVALAARTTYNHVKRAGSHSSARDDLERHRIEVLRRYYRTIDPLTRPAFHGHCPASGARLYSLTPA